MVSIRVRPCRLVVALLVLGAIIGVISPPRSSAQEAQTAPKSPAESSASATSAAPARSADQVMASLNRAMTWYRQARIVMRAVEGSGVFGPADEQTALRLLGRAFDVAHAEAALLGRDSATASGAGGRRAEEQKKIEAAVRQDERDVERLRARLRDEPEKRSTLERQLAAAQNRLDLEPRSASSPPPARTPTTISSIRSTRSGKRCPSSAHRMRRSPWRRRRRALRLAPGR